MSKTKLLKMGSGSKVVKSKDVPETLVDQDLHVYYLKITALESNKKDISLSEHLKIGPGESREWMLPDNESALNIGELQIGCDKNGEGVIFDYLCLDKVIV